MRASNSVGRMPKTLRTTLVLLATLLHKQNQHSSLLVQAQISAGTPNEFVGTGTSSISGQVFFDSSSDGTLDPTNALDYGVQDVFTALLTCEENDILSTTKTDSTGAYSFENIPAGRYYVNFQPESWYEFTEVWNGATDEISGELLYPTVDSSVDPKSGLTHHNGNTSPCTDLGEGESVSLRAGLKFYIPPVPVPVTPAPTPSPTPFPTPAPTFPAPTNQPTPDPTAEPTVTVTTLQPTFSPDQSVTIGGYVFADTNNNGYFDPGEDLLEGVGVQLYQCDVVVGKEDTGMQTLTGSDGFYDFGNLPPNRSYAVGFDYCIHTVDVSADEPCLMGSEVWIGQTDANGNLLAPDANSHANPLNGETACVQYIAGDEVRDVSAGVFHKSISLAPIPQPTPEPTTLEPTVALVTLEPTAKPTAEEPTVKPTVLSTSGDPTLNPTILSTTMAPNKPDLELPQPTDGETTQPSSLPSATASLSPSQAGTLSPTSLPSIAPSRLGEENGPVTTPNLQMTIRGVDILLPDESSWADATSAYIESFFNDNPEAEVWDVTVDILVDKVESVTPNMDELAAELFGRRRMGLRKGGRNQHSTRNLQAAEASVTVAYTQISKYKTSDATEYDGEYVATMPFMGKNDVYIEALTALDPTYSTVTSVGSVMVVPPPAPPSAEKTEESDGDDKTMLYAIIGGVCGAAVLVAAAVLILYRRKRARRDHVAVGNGPPESMQQAEVDNGDLESDSDDSSSDSDSSDSSDSDSDSDGARLASTSSASDGAPKKSRFSFRKRKNEGNGDADSTSNSSATTSTTPVNLAPSDVVLDVIAPPGKLGVIVDTPPEGGCAYVCEIKDSCPIIGQIQLEDKIIAIDDDDVQTMSAINVSKMLARRSRNMQRKITVLRAANGPSGAATRDNSGAIARADGLLGGMQNDDLQRAHSMAAVLGGAEPEPLLAPDKPKPGANEELIDLIAPAGKLGVVLVTPEPPDTGPAYVFKIREDSSLVQTAKLGDKIISVDDEDVREMSAINVSKLLGSKSANAERKITVLREIGNKSNEKEAGSLSDSISSESSASEGTTESSEDGNDKSGTAAAENVAAAAPTATGADQGDSSGKREIKLDIIAPAGKLGVVVDSPPAGGSAFVSDVKAECPVKGEIQLGDRIIAVDDEDVSKLKAIHVSMLLGSKSRNAQRKITVLRDG